jgi:hypothetical protein
MRLTTLEIPRITERLYAAELEQFEALLRDTLRCRQDRPRNLAAWVAGVAAAPSGRLSIPEVAKASAGVASTKQLRHVMESSPLEETLLRRRLVRAVPLDRVRAFSIEQHCLEDSDRHQGVDLYSLHAVGDGWLVTLGWWIELIPPADVAGEAVGIDDVEERAVAGLLDQLRGDYEAVEPMTKWRGAGPPPIILQAHSFGESKQLRMMVGDLHTEYIARVNGSYNDLHLRTDSPFERVEPNRQLQDHFAPVPVGANPPPREMLDSSLAPGRREYAVLLREDTGHEYAIARPLTPGIPSGLQGRKGHNRASELGQLAIDSPDTGAAERLRVTDLRNRNRDVLRRHGLLMSVLALLRTHRLLGARG